MSALWYVVAGAVGGVAYHYAERMLIRWGFRDDQVVDRAVRSMQQKSLLRLRVLVNDEIEQRRQV